MFTFTLLKNKSFVVVRKMFFDYSKKKLYPENCWFLYVSLAYVVSETRID